MPNYNPDNQLAATIKDLDDRLRNLENQPLSVGYASVVTTYAESTFSTGYNELTTTGPTVSINVGSSGKVLLTCSANIYNGLGLNSTAYVGVSIDSVTPTGSLAYILQTYAYSSTAQLQTGSSQSATVVLTGLAQGLHTFKMQYGCTLTAGFFNNRFLQVTPL